MPYTTVTNGTTQITKAFWEPNVRDQVVSQFASTSARDSAITSPVAGMAVAITSNDADEGIQMRTSANTWRRPWNMPWGIISVVTVTTSQGGITTVADLTSLTATWTTAARRHTRISLFGQLVSSVANDIAGLLITTGANAEVARTNVYLPSSGITSVGASVFAVVSPAAGTVTYKARLERVSGTGTIQSTASGVNPATLVIEDIGPAGAPS